MTEILFKQECFQIVGACFEVHKSLGWGFLEPVYQEALAIEMTEMNIPFVKEKNLEIYYKKKQLEKFYVADFICYNLIILELKALSNLTPQHEAQVINYLKATGIKLGLLINFGEPSLKYKRLLL